MKLIKFICSEQGSEALNNICLSVVAFAAAIVSIAVVVACCFLFYYLF